MSLAGALGQQNDPIATDTSSPWSANSLLRAIMAAVGGGGAIPAGKSSVDINTKTTTLVKSGAGVLYKIVVNKQGSADTITIYDALTATGTPLASISDTTKAPQYDFGGIKFSTGLTIVTGGTTAGDYTVVYL